MTINPILHVAWDSDQLDGHSHLQLRASQIHQLYILSYIPGKRPLHINNSTLNEEVPAPLFVLVLRTVNIVYVQFGWLMVEFSGFDVFLLCVGYWTDCADGECTYCEITGENERMG
jgi:hypothetical protein